MFSNTKSKGLNYAICVRSVLYDLEPQMCFGAQGTMTSHEMYWWNSEDLQHFLGVVLSVCAGILTPAACKKQVLLRQAFQNGFSKFAVGHGCR